MTHQVKELTNQKEWDAVFADLTVPVAVDFFGTWCPPCTKMAPFFEKMAEQYGAKMRFFKINVDEAKIREVKDISSLPTFRFYAKGRETSQVVGANPSGVKRYVTDYAL